MTTLTATIEGVGFWAPGLPSWDAARGFVRDGTLPDAPPARPSPQVLAPNERRRAPDTVAVALDVAAAACAMAGRDPSTLPSVFTSTHGELAITDYMCTTLADAPASISPTKFHNSVHNAAAGYWTIGSGCMRPATAISAFDASFAQGLIEALVQLATGDDAVLLVGYDGPSAGALTNVAASEHVLGGALVLTRTPRAGAPHIAVTLETGEAASRTGALSSRLSGNAMAPMLAIFEALASGDTDVGLTSGPGQVLRVHLQQATPPEPTHA